MNEKANQLKVIVSKLRKDFNIELYQECIQIIVELISDKLEELDYTFDDLDSMLRAAVMAQIIYDDEQWKIFINYFPEPGNQYSFLNSIQILEKNLND